MVTDAVRARRVVPARVRIMGWMLLLMAIVLVTVTLVTRTLLMQRIDADVTSALEQEAGELSRVARAGVDRATQQPFRNVRELLFNHLQRQHPDDDEVIVGWVAPDEVLAQDRTEPFRLATRRDVLDPILAADAASGTTQTDAGELRWIKVEVTGRAGDRGAFVVGYLVDRDRVEIDNTIQTLVVVSAAGLVVAALVAWVVAGQILAPVRLVRRAAAEITERDLTQRIPVAGRDDIAALASQFNSMLDRLEQAFATQRRFVDDASHELRTPITIVRGHLELMGDDPAERAAVVRLCTDELDRMGRIVADLLMLAKAERPDFVRVEPVPVAELTADLYAKCRALGDREWRLASIGECTARLDPQRVTQAVVQLAQNAVQHTAPGDEIHVGSSCRDGRVSFRITDRGPGVPAADRDVIFGRFTRGSTGGAAGHRAGAGLGLAIVRAIAEAHGGAVRLTSPDGGGATFELDLPDES